MRKIATILVTLLILSSITPYGVLAESLEANDIATPEFNPENEQYVVEGKNATDDLDETENSMKNIIDEDNNEKDEIVEIKTDKQIISEEIKEKAFTLQAESEEIETDVNAKGINELKHMSIPNATPTSRLGHIRNGNVKIYASLENDSSFEVAGSKYTNAVYYIKLQNTVNGNLYYLISYNASSTRGVVGWVKATDLSTHPHVSVDKKAKDFYIKGTGNAYDTAWGGSKNLVYDLSNYKDQIFKVHLTEKVGNNVWYRGTLDGKTVWIHSSDLVSVGGSPTSRLGHIRNRNVKIFSSLESDASFEVAGAQYTNAVYYIKSQSEINGKTYYLISTRPSNSKGLVGWVQASDLSTYSHTGVDKAAKTFYIKGNGKSYDKAWGGSKNLVQDLSKFKDHIFNVHLTEKVGNEIWYRGTLDGKTVWIHSSYLSSNIGKPTSRLGHIRNQNVKIYSSLANNASFEVAGSTYTDAVYYIKSQSEANGNLYYLLSTSPSISKGVVGWVQESDLFTYSHVGVDKISKTFYIKGAGNSYDKAWGGSQNIVYDLSEYKDHVFNVHLTEKVGNDIWYRGTLNGKTVWIHSSDLVSSGGSPTSRLGHIRNRNVKIYSSLESNASFEVAGAQYTNAVYYIKSQSSLNGQLYYLISTSPSDTRGLVGWVQASDLSTYSHVGVDRDAKTLYFKGTGKAYRKAWGGSKDLVYEDMSQYAYQEFKVNLTEKVGTNTWYRGVLNGETIWLHSSYVTTKTESTTSRLGHIRNRSVEIYPTIGDPSTAFIAGAQYTNAVYYIKKQAEIHDQIFYLISTSPSSTKGTVGWVNAKDLSTYSHITVDKKAKIFYIKGNGIAYSKAWGGAKDIVFENMDIYKNEEFKVDLTEKVGNNTWYRGMLNGKRIWLHSSYVNVARVSEYNLTLSEAVEMQMKASPQTDMKYAWVSKEYIDKNNKVTATNLNVRPEPNTKKDPIGSLPNGHVVKVLEEYNGWYAIEYSSNHQWRHAHPADVMYYLNPLNFINDDRQQFQFLDLSRNSSASVTELNKVLNNNGVLTGKGRYFIEAGNKYKINDIYLVSHAKLETGNGSSELANGISKWTQRDSKGNIVRDADGNPIIIDISPKKVYNVYGIGAFDRCARDCGAQRAYDNGWFSVETAIVEGAQFIGNGYVNAGQNTLYKMCWNPGAMEKGNVTHQYATDIGWAAKQTRTIYNLYQQLDSYTIHLDIPVYK